MSKPSKKLTSALRERNVVLRKKLREREKYRRREEKAREYLEQKRPQLLKQFWENLTALADLPEFLEYLNLHRKDDPHHPALRFKVSDTISSSDPYVEMLFDDTAGMVIFSGGVYENREMRTIVFRSVVDLGSYLAHFSIESLEIMANPKWLWQKVLRRFEVVNIGISYSAADA